MRSIEVEGKHKAWLVYGGNNKHRPIQSKTFGNKTWFASKQNTIDVLNKGNNLTSTKSIVTPTLEVKENTEMIFNLDSEEQKKLVDNLRVFVKEMVNN